MTIKIPISVSSSKTVKSACMSLTPIVWQDVMTVHISKTPSIVMNVSIVISSMVVHTVNDVNDPATYSTVPIVWAVINVWDVSDWEIKTSVSSINSIHQKNTNSESKRCHCEYIPMLKHSKKDWSNFSRHRYIVFSKTSILITVSVTTLSIQKISTRYLMHSNWKIVHTRHGSLKAKTVMISMAWGQVTSSIIHSE